MPDKQSRPNDNDLIDEMQEAPSQGSSSGGNLAKEVGKRAEQELGDTGVERVRGSDDPKRDARKGPKAISRMQGGG